jgi:hypothetical protein
MSNEINKKAKELVVDYYLIDAENVSEYGMEWQMAKQCAIIDIQNTIDELEDLKQHIDDNDKFFINTRIDKLTAIKQAIENL